MMNMNFTFASVGRVWRVAVPGPDENLPGQLLLVEHPDGGVRDWIPIDGKPHRVVVSDPVTVRFEIFLPDGTFLGWSDARPIRPGDSVTVALH